MDYYDYDGNEIVNGGAYKFMANWWDEDNPKLIFTLRFTNKMVVVNNKKRKIHCEYEDGEIHCYFEWYDETIYFNALKRIN